MANSNRNGARGRSPAPTIVLLQMPWATTGRPSIALAILARLCEREAVACRILYPNLDLEVALGVPLYDEFSNRRELYGLSEHLFAADLFGAAAISSDEYLARIARGLEAAGAGDGERLDVDLLRRLRDDVVPTFLDETTARVVAERPSVVGFTTTFNQVLSSLALAARIKQALDSVEVIVGGACVDGEMGLEYHRALPHVIDHVFLGEAEDSFADYLRRLKASAPRDGIAGVTSFAGGELVAARSVLLADLDESPDVHYDEYFSEVDRVLRDDGHRVEVESLPFESSRGCWWGQTNHCVFCGINDDLMSFRAKDVGRVVDQIAELARRHRVTQFTATDWIISRWHCDELFRRLQELDLDLGIFYELRPVMKKWQVKAMHDAGVTQVQPGIESFSTPFLKLIRKFTLAIRQIQFLRWCAEAGISTEYNILAGVPGDRAEWYLEQADLVPRLVHLQPPGQSICFVELHRFAPLHESRASFDIDTFSARADYRLNFPAGLLDPERAAYFFDHEAPGATLPEEYAGQLRRAVDAWIAARARRVPPVYEYRLGAGFLEILDTRAEPARELTLTGLHHDVVLLCDEVRTRRSLREALEEHYREGVPAERLDETIAELVAADVLLDEDGHYLTLPIGRRFRTAEELSAHVNGDSRAARREPVAAGR